MSRAELLQIRNFGDQSLNELYGKLREMDLLPAELDPEIQDKAAADDEEKVGVGADASTDGEEGAEL